MIDAQQCLGPWLFDASMASLTQTLALHSHMADRYGMALHDAGSRESTDTHQHKIAGGEGGSELFHDNGAAIRRRIESRTRVEGDRVQGQALAILDDILEGDTKTSCNALVSVCHVIARRNVDTAGLRILTSACADVTAVGIRPGRDEKNLD
ncbi:g9181 [Coccomyxa elongata]